jgi:hypothetical protein
MQLRLAACSALAKTISQHNQPRALSQDIASASVSHGELEAVFGACG